MDIDEQVSPLSTLPGGVYPGHMVDLFLPFVNSHVDSYGAWTSLCCCQHYVTIPLCLHASQRVLLFAL